MRAKGARPVSNSIHNHYSFFPPSRCAEKHRSRSEEAGTEQRTSCLPPPVEQEGGREGGCKQETLHHHRDNFLPKNAAAHNNPINCKTVHCPNTDNSCLHCFTNEQVHSRCLIPIRSKRDISRSLVVLPLRHCPATATDSPPNLSLPVFPIHRMNENHENQGN